MVVPTKAQKVPLGKGEENFELTSSLKSNRNIWWFRIKFCFRELWIRSKVETWL